MEELQQFGLQQCGGRASLLTLRVFNYSFSRLYRRTVFFFNIVTSQLQPSSAPTRVIPSQRFHWLSVMLWFRSKDKVVWACSL